MVCIRQMTKNAGAALTCLTSFTRYTPKVWCACRSKDGGFLLGSPNKRTPVTNLAQEILMLLNHVFCCSHRWRSNRGCMDTSVFMFSLLFMRSGLFLRTGWPTIRINAKLNSSSCWVTLSPGKQENVQWTCFFMHYIENKVQTVEEITVVWPHWPDHYTIRLIAFTVPLPDRFDSSFSHSLSPSFLLPLHFPFCPSAIALSHCLSPILSPILLCLVP